VIEIKKYISQSFNANCYLLIDSESGEAVVFDPSVYYHRLLISYLNTNLRYIILTHGHFDHMLRLEAWKKEFGSPVLIHERDKDYISDGYKNCSGIFMREAISYGKFDIAFGDNAVFKLGKREIAVINTPGHTPGSCCFIVDDIMITGDTLFKNEVGRADLPGGSETDQSSSMKKLRSLNVNYRILPGHGEETTLEEEKAFNPYLKI